MPGVVAVYIGRRPRLPRLLRMMQLHPAAVRPALARGQGPVRRRPRRGGRGRDQGAGGRRRRGRDRRLRPAPRGRRPWRTPSIRTRPLQFEAIGSEHRAGRSASPTGTTRSPGADVIVRGRFENQRLAVVPMEGAAIAVVPGDDGDGHQLTVYLGCQMPHMNRGGRRRQLRARARRRAPDRAARRRLVRRQALGAGRHRGGARRVRARSAGEVDRDPLGEPDRDAARPRPGAVRRARAAPRRHDRRAALPHHRRRRRLRRVRRHARVRPDPHDVAGRLPDPEDRLRRARSRSRTLAPMGAYRGAGRPEAAAMLERIIDMAAAELGMDPVELRRRNFLQPDEFPYTTVTGVTYDVGDYDAALDRGAAHRGLRGAARRAAGAPRARRREAARHRHQRLRRDHRGRLGERVRRGRGARRRERDHEGGHVGARPGPRDRVLAARVGRARHPDREHPLRAVRHRARAAGRRHRRLAVAAARRQRGARRVARGARARPEPRGRPARGRAGRHRADRGRHARRRRGAVEVGHVGGDLDQGRPTTAMPLVVEHDFVQAGSSFPFGAHVSVVEVDTETGASSRSATSRSTTAAAS